MYIVLFGVVIGRIEVVRTSSGTEPAHQQSLFDAVATSVDNVSLLQSVSLPAQ
jgi:hypothetical protein